MLGGLVNSVTKFTSKVVARGVVRDVAQLVDPQEADNSLIGKLAHAGQQLNLLAQGQPLPIAGPLEDNREESLIDAQLRLEFAFGERLSHDFAYRNITQQQTVVSLLEEDNTVRHYQLIKLSSDHQGIDGNILIPHSDSKRRRVYVNFRGSDPSVLATLHLDLESNAGEESFHRHYAKIMKQINAHIGTVSGPKQKPVELIISGYSLGGALSQHCFNLSMLLSALHLKADLEKEQVDIETQELITAAQDIVDQHLFKEFKIDPLKLSLADYQHFSAVQSFKINTWGSTGVSKSIEGCSNLIADILVNHGKDVIGRFGVNILDIVPRTGDARILSACQGDIIYMRVKDTNADLGRSLLSGCISGVAAGMFMGGPFGAVVGTATAITQGLRPIGLAHSCLNFGSTGEKLAGKQYETIFNTSLCDAKEIAHDPLAVLYHPYLIHAKETLRKAGDVGAKIKEEACKGIVVGLAHVHKIVDKAKSPKLTT
ncbi:hypothetical protein [Candidatus Berkiella aquae]|uniref:Uncharacterized protein n=1 Tax=Candidatus Berkiella aquae TaxID=295108 RepID=A0A0Q9YUB5_9GAMM|nr:hypothetical protein [Candidatus Berkiella aquae]MCS5712261.1 hypothetical protein [Candidatus Berkiella aquae]